jgi:serine/threonine protein kinase
MSVNLNLTKLVLPTNHRHTVSGPLVSKLGRHDVGLHIDNSGLRESSTVDTPPTTPDESETPVQLQLPPETAPEILEYDFSKLDYELDRAKLLGSGLWGDVYLAEPTSPQSSQTSPTLLTPPATPQKVSQPSRALTYAVKLPIRSDAHQVFQQEAKILTRIHHHKSSESFIVPFHGLDPRNSALVFTALQSGSLTDLSNRMSQMTELCRHQELVLRFPSLAHDLTSGLDFLHTTAGVIHADIKPANILLSPSPHNPKLFQARYADFSASFFFQSNNPSSPDSSESTNTTSPLPAGGGTWTFLAPEQLRLSKAENEPTPASDAWSLGLTLLSLIILGSPYAAACGDNAFRLREAIKTGDPLGFAAMDPAARKRMQACQVFVDFCRLALQKDKTRRVETGAWRAWVERQGWGGGGAEVVGGDGDGGGDGLGV